MINLLPYENKKQMKASRLNTVLLVYAVITITAAAFLYLACFTTYGLIEKEASIRNIDTAEVKTAKINEAKLILDQQISYSDVLNNLNSILPSDATALSLITSDEPSGKIITVTLASKSGDIDSILQTNIQNLKNLSNYKLISKKNLTDGGDYKFETVFSLNINKGLN